MGSLVEPRERFQGLAGFDGRRDGGKVMKIFFEAVEPHDRV